MSLLIRFLATIVLFGAICEGYIEHPGPKVIATKGEVWPKPQVQEKSEDYKIIRPHIFNFQVELSGFRARTTCCLF